MDLGLCIVIVAIFLIIYVYLLGRGIIKPSWYARYAEEAPRYHPIDAQRRAAGTAQRRAQASIYETVHPLAIEAMQDAGHNPEDLMLPLVDVGMLVYTDKTSRPQVARIAPLPPQARYARPFAVLRVRIPGDKTVGFILRDGSGQVRLRSLKAHRLTLEDVFLYADQWLQLDTHQQIDPNWTLEVTVNQAKLGVHDFHWHAGGTQHLAGYISEEGELEDAALRLIQQNVKPMSLDDLLNPGGTGPENPAKTQRRED